MPLSMTLYTGGFFMIQYRKILELHFKDISQRTISTSVSASSRIEQLTLINFEHFRSQTCSDDVSYGSFIHVNDLRSMQNTV